MASRGGKRDGAVRPRGYRRSTQASEYRRFYNTKAWSAARQAQLSAHPLCELCEETGRMTPATVVNHRKAHKGDWALFIDPANHQSVCAPCHDGAIQSYERTGSMRGCDESGMPLDPNHPWNCA